MSKRKPCIRTRVRDVGCPKCGAAPGEHCIRARGKKPRYANHRERVACHVAARS